MDREVPRLVPSMGATDCARFIRPALMKPTNMTEAAEEWTRKPSRVPRARPAKRLAVVLVRRVRRPLPAAVRSPSDMMPMPRMNRASPPRTSKIRKNSSPWLIGLFPKRGPYSVPGEEGSQAGGCCFHPPRRLCDSVTISNGMGVPTGGFPEGQALSCPGSGRIAAAQSGQHGGCPSGYRRAPNRRCARRAGCGQSGFSTVWKTFFHGVENAPEFFPWRGKSGFLNGAEI